MEILKEFKSILLGYEIEIHTDHKNLVHETMLMNSDRVMRWRLIIEEYGTEIKYIPGTENVVADALRRLTMAEEEEKTKELFDHHIESTHHLFASRKIIPDESPLDMKIITCMQRKEISSRTVKLKECIRDPKSAYTRSKFENDETYIFKEHIYIYSYST